MARHTRRRRVQRTRRVRKTRGGYVTSQQFFNPDVLQPVGDNALSSQPTDAAIRPVMNSTFKVGGKRHRRQRAGFSPSIMGSFLQNAKTAIVPLALYSAYHLMPKKSRNLSRRR